MTSLRLALFGLAALATVQSADGQARWRTLSSARGDLPVPGPSTQQTAALVADLDGDGRNDFVLGFRQQAPAVVWYRRTDSGWTRHVVEPALLTVEAGGAVHDIDRDGDLDLVFGGDWQSSEVWWWANPGSTAATGDPWVRRVIKSGGATQHHDQVFGDFLGTGAPQLVSWNQGGRRLLLARVPERPLEAAPWPITEIFKGTAGEGPGAYAEGLAAADVDGDGRTDLLAGNAWFKHEGGSRFRPIRIGEIGGRIAVGRFRQSPCPQVVIAPGDGTGPLRWYECVGEPSPASAWVGHTLGPRDMVHGHTLEVADVNGDGHDDVFAAEMAKWTEGPGVDHPESEAWIFYGDGRGNFRREVLATGVGFHEGRLADLDGDGDMDILQKPYTWEAPRVDVWLQLRAEERGAQNGER